MKQVKRLITFCLLTTMILAVVPKSVNACDKTSGCYSTSVEAVCSDVKKISAGDHQIGEPSGNVITCHITVVYGEHQLYCLGCRAYLGTDKRTCSTTHSSSKYCTSRYNMCK